MFVLPRPGNFVRLIHEEQSPSSTQLLCGGGCSKLNNLLECKPRPLRRERLLVRCGCTELISVPPFLFDVGQLGVDDLVSVGALFHNRIVLHLKIQDSATAQNKCSQLLTGEIYELPSARGDGTDAGHIASWYIS